MQSRPGACGLGFPLAGLLASCTEAPDCAKAASRAVAPCGHSHGGGGWRRGKGILFQGSVGQQGQSTPVFFA